MALQKLPRHLLEDILDLVFADECLSLSEILSLRLVDRHFNTEIIHAFYVQNLINIHTRAQDSKKPKGASLERVVRGFVVRPKGTSNVLNTIWRALRDAVLILSVLLDSTSDHNARDRVLNACASSTTRAVEDENAKQPHVSVTSDVGSNTEEEAEEILDENALSSMCKAYVSLLGEERAFDSLDPSSLRAPEHFAKLEDKTGHFWAFLTAAHDGRPNLIEKAAKASRDRYGDEEESLTVKVHFAGGLLLSAKQKNMDAAKAILAQPEVRVNLRFQNLRFAGANAMEAAIEASDSAMVRFLLDQGWNLTTVPMDYVRTLKSITSSMEPSPLRIELLKTLLEGECQQWRSESVTNGMFQELCKRGDLDTCQSILSLLKIETTGKHEWQWTIEDTTNSDNITTTAPANPDEEDEWTPYDQILENNALFQAVSKKHEHMVSLILDNRDYFPELKSEDLPRFLLRCFEHVIKTDQDKALSNLLPYIGDLCPQRLFLYAVLLNKLPAMKTLHPLIDLEKVNNDHCDFWDFSYNNSDLYNQISQFTEHRHPNNFLFQVYTYSPRNIKLGTYALLCAIKSLHIDITKYLLSHNCTIGLRLKILSPNFLELRHARLFLPHDTSTCEDCTPRVPHFGSWMIMGSLSKFSRQDIKNMLEAGAQPPQSKTRYLTKRNRVCLWRWSGESLEETEARIITALQIPYFAYNNIPTPTPEDNSDETDNDNEEKKETRFQEMRKLMRKWKLPDLYLADHD